LNRLFFILRPPVPITRELQIQLAEFAGGRSQDLGQMQMYVNYFDSFVKTEAENHTIGIVLCTKKNAALVEITLPKDANIHAREYQLYLPSKEELKRKLEEWIDGQAD
ncbi:Protein of unknown function, partial [Bryocella elongata]